jgi:hypothetical protein
MYFDWLSGFPPGTLAQVVLPEAAARLLRRTRQYPLHEDPSRLSPRFQSTSMRPGILGLTRLPLICWILDRDCAGCALLDDSPFHSIKGQSSPSKAALPVRNRYSRILRRGSARNPQLWMRRRNENAKSHSLANRLGRPLFLGQKLQRE